MNFHARLPRLALLAALAAPLAIAQAPAYAQGLRLGTTLAPRAARVDGPQQGDYIVAIVNSEPVTNNEVRLRMARFEQQLLQAGQPVPARAEFLQQVLERLISEKAQLQLAKDNGIKIEDTTVDQAEQNIARSNQMEVADLRRQVVGEGSTVAAFREDLRNQLTLQRVREREVEARVRVSDLELDQFLREQQGKLEIGAPEFNLGHILILVPENASEAQVAAATAKATRVLQRLRANEDFAKVAREMSDAPGTQANGGIIGRRTLDRYPPLFAQAVQGLPEGAVADPIRSTAGFHILKVIERRRNVLTAGATVEQSHVRHILLRPGPQLTEAAALAKLQDAKRRVLAGQADFATLAREMSQDASARNGGDLGWTNPGMYVPEFEEVMNSLAPGQLSDPLISRFGVHLMQLIERRQNALTQREQRDMVRNVLREKKADEGYALWVQEVRGRAFVELRDPPQ